MNKSKVAFSNSWPNEPKSHVQSKSYPSLHPMPAKMTIDSIDGATVLHWRWIQWPAILGLVFSTIWLAVLGFLIGLLAYEAINSGNIGQYYGQQIAPFYSFFEILIAIAQVVALLIWAYISFAWTFNSTTIVIDDNQLSIKHGPIPRFRPIIYGRNEVRELYSKENRPLFPQVIYSQGKLYEQGDIKRQNKFDLYSIDKAGNHHRLLKNLATPDYPLFLESLIHELWDIEKQPTK